MSILIVSILLQEKKAVRAVMCLCICACAPLTHDINGEPLAEVGALIQPCFLSQTQ